MDEKQALMYGIIHIGSSSLSMMIVNYEGIDNIHVIEHVKKDISYGEEVFLHKELSFSSLKHLCSMLNGLKQLLRDYRVTEYAVYGTAIFREAKNWRLIRDLIHVYTGFMVNVVDMPQEIYFKHFALQYQLRKINNRKNQEFGSDFLFVDITSGCIGLTVWKNNHLKYQHNVHVGTLRLLEIFNTNQRASNQFSQALSEYIHTIMRPLWEDILNYHPRTLVITGQEARTVTKLLRLHPGRDGLVIMNGSVLTSLYEDIADMTPSRISQEYNIDADDATAVVPTIYMFKEILDHISVDRVLMMGTSFVEAVTMYYGAEKTNNQEILNMRLENLELTRELARRFYYEPEHSRVMCEYAHTIIEAFRNLNGLTERDEFLLAMAIILYQVGKHVNLIDATSISWNLIRAFDIFGVSNREKDIVAAIAYYDHRGNPSEDDRPFAILKERSKMTVMKLTAIFRLVRAMDVSRKQKLKDVTARLVENTLIIEYDSNDSTALETWNFEKEDELFKGVFGIEAKLERR